MSTELSKPVKPLGIRAYGHIPHLSDSRMGPGDHHCHEGQARICTERVRDRHDEVIVTEKLDGTCVAVARQGDTLCALSRRGYLCASSPFEMHHVFGAWVEQNSQRFFDLLYDGSRIVGEWLAQAHGTRYKLTGEPFVAFDLMVGHERLAYGDFLARIGGRLVVPHELHRGGALSIPEALARLGQHGFHGAIDAVEGAVWRVERRGRFDFLAKYVKPWKVDGCYLPEQSGQAAIWNWRPEAETQI